MDQVDHMFNPGTTGKPYYHSQYYPSSSTSHDQIGSIGVRGPPSLQNVQQRDRHMDYSETYGSREQGLDPRGMLSQLAMENGTARGQQPYMMDTKSKGSMPPQLADHSSMRGPPETVWSPSSRMSMSITNSKGLLNGPGENNCFLNSAVQVLWHLDVFRRNFRMLTGHACMGNSCIFCALKVIFTQFQYSDQSALPPDALRKALAQNFSNEQRFQLGHMDDAAECFENILTRIHRHIAQDENEDMCNAQHCITHQKFAMTVVEQVVCNKCGATSEPHPFSQMVHYVSTSALAWHTQRMVKDGLPAEDVHRAFSLLLRNASSEGDMRSCPSDCGERIPIRKNLINCPDVVSIGLIWDSDRPDSDHITQVNRCIGKNIVLYHLFHLADTRASTLELRGVVCYYGKHYSTFFFTKKGIWIYFDDATVREIGPDWSRVVDKMCRGRYQPLLLLYTNPNATAIDTDTALQKTTMVPGHEPFNWPGSPGNPANTGNQGPASVDSRNSTQSHSRPAPRAGQYRRTREMPPSATLRRAVTPNPESQQQREEFTVEPRRAVTPTPEWHAYDSDEDSANKKQLAVDHRRQSSYLIAVTGLPEDEKTDTKGHNAQTDLINKVAPPMVQNSGDVPNSNSGADEVDNWTLSTQGQYRRPNAPQLSPNSTSAFSAPIFSKQGPQKRDSGKKGRPKLGADIIRYQSNSDTSPSPNGLQTDGFEFGQSGSKPGSEYIAGFDFSRDMEDQIKMEPLPEHIVVNPNPYPHTVKRAVSVDERLGGDITSDKPQQQVAAAHKKRPHSARSGRTKELLDQGYGSLPRKSTRHQTISNPYYPQEYLNQNQIHEMLHGKGVEGTTEPLPKKTMSRYNSESRIDAKYTAKGEDVSDNNYISRRAVESILNKQKIIRQNSSSSASSGVPTPVLPRKDLAGEGERDGFCLPLNKPALKVDIPDNVSRDSGYSGDRASSASSTSADSPLLDPRHTNGAFFGRTHGPMLGGKSSHGGQYDGKSSSESLNSNQGNNGNIQQFKTDRNLTQIPENIATFQAPKATAFFKEKLRESSKQGSKPESTEINVTKKGPMRIQKEYEGDEPDGAETFEKLCLKAEELENESFEKERRGDLHMSMWLCTQATAYFKKAMNAPGASQHSMVHAQKKHSTCVLRSRSLHRRIMSRQTSAQSTCSEVSSEDHISISSLSTTDTDTKDLDSPPVRDELQMQSREIPRQTSAPDLQSTRHRGDGGHRHRSEGMHRSHSVHGRMAAPPIDSNIAQQPRKPLPSYQEVMFRRSTSVSEAQHRGQSEIPHSKSSDGVSNSAVNDAERGIQLYGTLPKKSKQKAGPVAASAAPVGEQGRGANREAEIYQDYLSKQKVVQSQQQQQQLVPPPGDQFDRISITSSQTVPTSLGPTTQSQSKMTKEEIRRLLQQNMIEKQRSRSSDGQGMHSRQSSTLSTHSNLSDVSSSKYSISLSHSQQPQHPMGPPSQTQGKQLIPPVATQQMQYPQSIQHQQPPVNNKRQQQQSRHPQVQPSVSQPQSRQQQSVVPPQPSSSTHPPQQQSTRIPRHAPEKIYAVPNSRPVIPNHNPLQQGPTQGVKVPQGQHPQGVPQGPSQHPHQGSKLDFKESHYAVPRVQPDANSTTGQIKKINGPTRPSGQVMMNGPTNSSGQIPSGLEMSNGPVINGQGIPSKLRQLEQQNLQLFQSQQQWQAANTKPAPVKPAGKKVPPPPPVRKDSVLSSPKPVQNTQNKVLGAQTKEQKVDAKATNGSKNMLAPSVDDLPLPPYPETNVTSGPKQNGLHTRDDSYIFVEKPLEIKHSRQRSDPSSLQNGLLDLDQLGVKDLATKFETLNTGLVDASKTSNSTSNKGPSQRRRSTGSRAQRKKSVTFSENIILIGDPDESEESYDKFMHVLHQTLQRREANSRGAPVNGGIEDAMENCDEDDFDDDSVDSFEMIDAPADNALVCNLCNMRQVVEGQTYCHHCSYYMAQFQPKT
ncbi:uncharacterized protein LOC106156068 isoform X1 [Lingula anatina]|uniref:Uncharacterized protein LOC106156068 isoform X1 n=1 Tax=Lingula anatina TaxID=7574 RepID=A0A1S3HKI5_LINAN|nr:uncharacterized protein LOC106156068 isoform X1 [Lingula anatina]XP_013386620.1 uncharacterized protein LOC106156068 isoform X1 [Lingula anatina]XP_013386621.1 uncharacterized protein LOC106156068 isoform X1 [Lingula anatina]XP_013386622.1 uncharacterized protein LOC106156068 isoform X1 [Lingula anatina]XP_013386623.1 uncharacterized protein LOC106156068 isoform X1 [Lingula anatina]XP_013386626.1 uncharacterized protein LOC106156068 isoform X1 [Lingula anatina]XP_023932521.1 uncharacterize|eukprot:XP_013386619.1 uncharacterized protein LOC106156068 isoform X1 [Lingula anatina]